MNSKLTRSGARRRGDEYQDFVGLDILVDWLEHSDRYRWVKFEADNAGSLDDVVAEQSDGVTVLKQVKYSNYPDNEDDELTWDDLFKKNTEKSTSLLQKWSSTVLQFLQDGKEIKASVVSNRKPSHELIQFLPAGRGYIQFDNLPEALQKRLALEIGSETKAKIFFDNFDFQLNSPNYEELKFGIERRFMQLGGQPPAFLDLSRIVRQWVAFKDKPRLNGQIILEDVKRAAGWFRPNPLPQEFEIPGDYILPSDQFHDAILGKIDDIDTNCIIISANPGVGKSTYCSYLFQTLVENEDPVIRHHYFLSTFDTNTTRLDFQRAAESLLYDLIRFYAHTLGDLANKNPDPLQLREYLEACGDFYIKESKQLILIIDGLDHVWRKRRSIDELILLFEQILDPIPMGVMVIVATQPLSDEMLPPTLLKNMAREDWIQLASLTPIAVDKWLEFHQEDIWKDRSNIYPQERKEISDAFFERSQGHPLYLKYALREVMRLSTNIDKTDVLNLPSFSGSDITEYYSVLWQSVESSSHATLTMLAACQFAWPEEGIIKCLMLQGMSISDATHAFNEIEHLMSENPLGLQAFHSSLLVYIQGLPDYQRMEQIQLGYVIQWLSSEEAPEYLRWGYLWLFQAKKGIHQPIINGVSRDWAIDAFVNYRSRPTMRQIFTKGLEVSLNQGKLVQAFEQALLYDRCFSYNNMGFEREVYEILLFSRLMYPDDKYLMPHLLSELRTLNNGEISVLAESFSRAEDASSVNECLDEIQVRLDRSTLYMSRGYSSWTEIVMPLIEIAAMKDSENPYRVLRFAVINRDIGIAYQMIREYMRQLWIHGNFEVIRVCLSVTPQNLDGEILESQEIELIQKYTVLNAVENDLDISDILPLSGQVDASVVLYNYKKELDLSGFEMTLCDLKLYQRGRYEHRDEAIPTWTLYYESLFIFIAKSLKGETNDIESWLKRSGEHRWHLRFLKHLFEIAKDIVKLLQQNGDFTIGWFIQQINRFDRPSLYPNDEEYEYVAAANQAIIPMILDLHIYLNGTNVQLQESDLIELKNSPFIYFTNMLKYCYESRRSFFSESALTWLINSYFPTLRTSVEYFPERAEQFAILAAIFAIHNQPDVCHNLMRETSENLVAYGEHKDLLLNEVLDAIVVFHKHQPSEKSPNWLSKLAIPIAKIGEFTNGDETGHLSRELADALAIINPNILIDYYEWLSKNEEYYDAEHTFRAWLKIADLKDPLVRRTAATGVDYKSIQILKQRSEAGDVHATDILDEITNQYGENVLLMNEDDNTSQTSDYEQKDPPAIAEYEPQDFARYYGDLRTKRIYSVEEPIINWIRYWVAEGKKQEVYTAMKEFVDSGGELHNCYDELFDLAISLYGKDHAYSWLIKAHQDQMGWHHYWAREERAYRRWEIIKTRYPNKSIDFLYDTIRKERPGYLTWYFDHFSIVRVVEYLLYMNESQLAESLIDTLVSTSKDFIPIELEIPKWIP